MAYHHGKLDRPDEPLPDSSFEFVDAGYGKNFVKMLHIRRDGPTHYIKEFTVNTQLTLDSKKDYLFGDNSDIVGKKTPFWLLMSSLSSNLT